MKAGQKDRVSALRLVLSELQKAAKEGDGDELAAQEEGEAELIAAYLPAELGDDELDSLVAEAVAESGAASPQDMGKVMGVLMPKVGGRADGRRVSAKVKERLAG